MNVFPFKFIFLIFNPNKLFNLLMLFILLFSIFNLRKLGHWLTKISKSSPSNILSFNCNYNN